MDIALFFDNDRLTGDVAVVAGQLATDDGLLTAVLISLFSDARASDDDLPPGETWRRGWAGEAEVGPAGGAGNRTGSRASPAGDRFGSKLWLRQREKQTESTRALIQADAEEALAWLKADQVAKEVEVTTAWVAHEVLGLEVVVVKPDGTRLPFRFRLAWAAESERS